MQIDGTLGAISSTFTVGPDFQQEISALTLTTAPKESMIRFANCILVAGYADLVLVIPKGGYTNDK